VEKQRESDESGSGGPVPSSTLGAVLYGAPGKRLVSEAEWVGLVRAVAARDEAALHALYRRSGRLVFALAVRIGGSRETAEEVTLDVFHGVWERASAYDPANGTVLGWIMNQARSRAIDRLRFEHRRKRVDPGMEEPLVEPAADPVDLLALKQAGEKLRQALEVLTPDERAAIEAAFFSELSHGEVAVRLDAPLGTVKTRIRSGLQKLRSALAADGTGGSR
jgi:RNA polymerase sigma-70 factor (ECF subfamily)